MQTNPAVEQSKIIRWSESGPGLYSYEIKTEGLRWTRSRHMCKDVIFCWGSFCFRTPLSEITERIISTKHCHMLGREPDLKAVVQNWGFSNKTWGPKTAYFREWNQLLKNGNTIWNYKYKGPLHAFKIWWTLVHTLLKLGGTCSHTLCRFTAFLRWHLYHQQLSTKLCQLFCS